MARSLTDQLQTTCLVLLSGVQGLPQHIQEEALSLSHSASEVYSNFSKAYAFGDLPDSVLASSKTQLGKMKKSLDDVMDYLVNNTPLNWLVGPFYPQLAPNPTPTSACSQSQPEKATLPDLEMKSMDSNHLPKATPKTSSIAQEGL